MLCVTRKQFGSAIDRILGEASSASVLRDVRHSITQTRAAALQPRPIPSVIQSPIREFVDTLTRRRQTDSMLKRLRLAVARVSRLR